MTVIIIINMHTRLIDPHRIGQGNDSHKDVITLHTFS